mmetsp:Transcript_38638/g.70815  ORF Transcript_38638/g.70815 Transcript_38638/m.70815 type:complete len:201 (-) Transcript_38638:1804-2406(-)
MCLGGDACFAVIIVVVYLWQSCVRFRDHRELCLLALVGCGFHALLHSQPTLPVAWPLCSEARFLGEGVQAFARPLTKPLFSLPPFLLPRLRSALFPFPRRPSLLRQAHLQTRCSGFRGHPLGALAKDFAGGRRCLPTQPLGSHLSGSTETPTDLSESPHHHRRRSLLGSSVAALRRKSPPAAPLKAALRLVRRRAPPARL